MTKLMILVDDEMLASLPEIPLGATYSSSPRTSFTTVVHTRRRSKTRAALNKSHYCMLH